MFLLHPFAISTLRNRLPSLFRNTSLRNISGESAKASPAPTLRRTHASGSRVGTSTRGLAIVRENREG